MKGMGIIAEKAGMSRIFDPKSDRYTPITLVKIDNNVVLSKRAIMKTIDRKHVETTAIQVASHIAKEKHVAKPQRVMFEKQGVALRRHIVQFSVAPRQAELLEVGQSISADFFNLDEYVDVAGVTIGKGFAGPMKRHNFGGLRATHGVSVSHRSHGSTGQRQDPGRVFKNKKMAGRMGGNRRTTQNLQIMFVDKERHILGIKGGLPGPKGSLLFICRALKKTPKEIV